jgi:hypothetical protein
VATITDVLRQALIESGAMTEELDRVIRAGEPVWTTEELREQFTVEGFQAPFVVVVRKADNVRGSLCFTHRPRLYFGFASYEEAS